MWVLDKTKCAVPIRGPRDLTSEWWVTLMPQDAAVKGGGLFEFQTPPPLPPAFFDP